MRDFREREMNRGWRRRSEMFCDWSNLDDWMEGKCRDHTASLDQNGGWFARVLLVGGL